MTAVCMLVDIMVVGQLGIGNTTNQSTPQLLSKSDWARIYAMGDNVPHISAGIDTSGDLYTWGAIWAEVN